MIVVPEDEGRPIVVEVVVDAEASVVVGKDSGGIGGVEEDEATLGARSAGMARRTTHPCIR